MTLDQVILYNKEIDQLNIRESKQQVYQTLLASRGDEKEVDKFFKLK